MKLERFRVTNFRSVQDSGWVEFAPRTVMIGRNESGKSNMLLALHSLKPAGVTEPLHLSSDFPADRPPSQCRPDLHVVETVWLLSAEEREELSQLLPGADGVERVRVGRSYDPKRWVSFEGLDEERAPDVATLESVESLLPTEDPIESTVQVEEPIQVEEPLQEGFPLQDAEPVAAAAITEGVVDGLGFAPEPGASDSAELEVGGEDHQKLARDWVLERMPTFLYLDEYPEIEGSLNLADYLRCRDEDRLEPRHRYFEKLLTAAGLEASDVHGLLSADAATRRRIVSHAGLTITRRLRQLWTDRALKVRFDLDGEHFNTLVSDPNEIYDVEINLEQRSRGFRWFFSFFVAFAARENRSPSSETILLLDEPALHLHAVGQRDFLNQLENEFSSQVLLATQSPFLVPTNDLAAVRTVSFSPDTGTQVSNEVAGDAATLVPVVHALGAEIARGLLDGSWNLVVEDVTDYWYLLAASSLLRESGSPFIPPKLSITPAGKSGAVLHMMGMLGGAGVPAIVLRSDEPTGSGLEQEAANTVFLSEALDDPNASCADIEDLLDPSIYDQSVKVAHRTQLGDRQLELDPSIPRVVNRYEQAFARLGLSFSRSQTARVFVRALLKNGDQVLPTASRTHFERLFAIIRERFEALGG